MVAALLWVVVGSEWTDLGLCRCYGCCIGYQLESRGAHSGEEIVFVQWPELVMAMSWASSVS